MARTLLNATTGSFLTETDIQGNSLDVINLNTASGFNNTSAPSKATLNGTAGLTDQDYHVMEGFGARDARHEEATSDHNSFRSLSNPSTQVNDAESTKSVLSGSSKSDTATNAEGTATVQAPLKAAASINTVSTNATAESSSAAPATSSAAPANVATATTAGFPDATNTGLKAGVAMTKYNGTLHITQDNAVISNMEINGDIIIDAKNVTVSNVKVNSNGAWTAIKVMDNATGFTLQDSEIDAGSGGNGVYGFGTFLRNNIHDMENGISLSGPSLVQDNYIHTFRGSAEAHYDGIEVNGGSNINIVHNTVVNDQNQTSAVMLDNYFGGLSNITVENNRLVGGGYTVYLDARFDGGAVDASTIKLINNQVGKGAYGDFAIFDSKPVMYGNTDLDTLPATAIVYTGTEGNDNLPLAGKVDAGAETYKGLGGNDLLKGGAGADTLDGGAGTDTASYAGSAAVNVNLLLGTATGGHAAGDKLISIENLIGSSYADTLTGDSGVNVLTGGAGGDKLDGGAGIDTASYMGSKAGVTASLANAALNTGDAKGDSYIAIERLAGSIYADKLYGNASDNMLIGNAGNDVLSGGSGNDVLHGGAGADTLDGGAGTDTASYTGSAAVNVNLLLGTATGGHATGDKLISIENLIGSSYADTLTGNSGNNVLTGGAGGDTLDGGAGTDTASYAGAAAGVTASLTNAAINTGDAKGDSYVSIEQLTGTSYADKLYGNGGANLLTGGSGNDVLDGGSGNDVLYGGAGADDLVGGAGADTFTFKALSDSTVATSGRDTILDFSGTGGDRIDLSAIDANTTASGNQAFTYLGTAAFTGKAGELRYVKDASDTYVYGDVNGDAKADFAVHLDDAVTMTKGYFVL